VRPATNALRIALPAGTLAPLRKSMSQTLSDITIRPATVADLEAINDIYNEAVAGTVATFDLQPWNLESRRAWFDEHAERHPVLAAEVSGQVVAWASLSRWSRRCAYADTVEDSLYVREGFRGRGVGRRLLAALMASAERQRFHSVIAQIAEGNAVSVHLHDATGFRHVGVLREVGFKFGRLLDVYIMQKVL
jgi:phosphinothricin acetyltransferase